MRAIRGAPEREDVVNSEILMKAVIEQVWRSTGRVTPSELRYALGGRNRVTFVVHLMAMMERVW
jgi:hypothetical protein